MKYGDSDEEVRQQFKYSYGQWSPVGPWSVYSGQYVVVTAVTYRYIACMRKCHVSSESVMRECNANSEIDEIQTHTLTHMYSVCMNE